MLKILFIIPSLNKGGAERLLLDICNELQLRENIQLKLLILYPQNEYDFMSKHLDIIICKSSVKPSITSKTIVNLSEYNRIIKIYKPNIIHSHLFEAELVSRWETRSEIKYFSHCHDNMPQFRKLGLLGLFIKHRLASFFEKKLITKRYKKCNNQFIAISNHTKVFFEKNLPHKLSKNVILLQNAINFSRFDKNKKPHNFLRLINVGSFVYKKNQRFLIEVALILQTQNIDFEILLIGDGPLMKTVEDEIKLNKLEKLFRLTGNISNVEDFYSESDIYVHSAIYEPFGLVLLEAMAAGLPVISLDGKGNTFLIEQGKNGFLLNERCAKDFADKIILIWQNKEKLKFMSNYAKQFASQHDMKSYVDKLLEIYVR